MSIDSDFPAVADAVFSSFEIDESYLPRMDSEEERFQALRAVLIRRIEELIDRDTAKLMWVLYRIDVNEKKVREALEINSSLDYAAVLADLIIARQIEKAESRRRLSTGDSDWSFDI